MTAPADLVAAAESILGQHELPPGSNRTTFGDEVGLTPAQWCMQAMSHVMRAAGWTPPNDAQHPGRGWSSVGFFASYARAHGWAVDGPDVGVFPCYEWEHDSWPDHVGIVTAVHPDGSFSTIEGNVSDPTNPGIGDDVARKVRVRSEVTTWVRIPLDASSSPAPVPAPSAPTPRDISPHPWLSNGVLLVLNGPHHDFNALFQRQLQKRGWKIGVDGLFGPETLRITRAFQSEKFGARGTDGIVGQQTWNGAFELPVT